MACSKQISIAASVTDQFTPLSSAVYVASVNQILGTCENYICRFNATTGAYISQVKATSPMYGPMHLGMVGVTPWVSAWNEKYNMGTVASHPLRDIFPVNATTLALGPSLDADTRFGAGNVKQWWGPLSFVSIGTGIYFVYTFDGAMQLSYIDSANHATWNVYTLGFIAHQLGVSATNIYCPDNFSDEIRYFNTAGNSVDYSSTGGNLPVACEWVSGVNKCFAVCGSKWLIRVDNFATSTNTYIDLEAETGIVGLVPFHLRYNSVDGLLYIPVQNKDGVIVYDPAGVAPTLWKTGFDSPLDVVFTPTKKFAVQTGLVGLREIT